MKRSDHIIYLLETNLGAMKKLLDDISEEESLHEGADKLNHIRWQTGHLVYCGCYMAELLGDSEADHQEYEKPFGAGEALPENNADYPPFGPLRAKLYDIHEKMIELAKDISDEDLEKPANPEKNDNPRWRPITFLLEHEFYHLGQIQNMRRSLGRERPFG